MGSVIFPFSTSMPSVLPTVVESPIDVENVVLDLERGAEGIGRRFRAGLTSVSLGAGELCAKRSRRRIRTGRLERDDPQVRLLVQIPDCCDYRSAATRPADLVGRPADQTGGVLRIEARAQVIAVADQIIAQQDRRLVAAQMVDRRALRRSSASSSTSS